MTPSLSEDRRTAVDLLEATGRRPFDFQAEAAARCAHVLRRSEQLLVQAPTGSGKTLIAFLAVALSARQAGSNWRGLLIVPTRPLLRQHIADAGWLRTNCDIPVHFLGPESSWEIWRAMLDGPGLVCTTPQSLRSRLERFGSLGELPLDAAIFDEIDIFLTVDHEERRDLWPVLQACLDADTPVLGFTGTALDPTGLQEWLDRGFQRHEPEVPDGWLPFTRVAFRGVRNHEIVVADLRIEEQLGGAYGAYEAAGGNSKSWRMIKLDAVAGPRTREARRILTLHAERLQLFEGDQDASGKLAALTEAVSSRSAVVLCRYIKGAESVRHFLSEHTEKIMEADGSMCRGEIERRSQALRHGDIDILVITRDLGGRGLDFPSVSTEVLLSPRASYQAVAQELARIRSRRESIKTATILYYEATTEALKAHRLADHLVRDNTYRGQELFQVEGFPGKDAIPSREALHIVHEESLTLE